MICYNLKGSWLYLVIIQAAFCFAESDGTLTLPKVESFQRLRDDDATTISSDDSFFSAAEVSIVFSYCTYCLTTISPPPHIILYFWALPVLRSCSRPCLWKMSISRWSQQLFTKKHCVWSGKTRCNIDPWGKCIEMKTELNTKTI